MLIPAGARWGWDGVHPQAPCVCVVFFLQNNLQWAPYPNTPTVSVGVGAGCVPIPWYETCYKHTTGLDFTEPPDESLPLPLPLRSLLAIPQVLTRRLTACPRGPWSDSAVSVCVSNICACASSWSFWGQSWLSGGASDPSDLCGRGRRELRPLALVTICQVNKLHQTRLELWSQENRPF